MPVVVVAIMRVPTVIMVIGLHIFVGHVIHATNRALARLLAAAAFAVHWADVGRGILFALLFGVVGVGVSTTGRSSQAHCAQR